ncbi:MAG TPA: TIGR01212 family radical SAM protein [Candidatus Faecousia excrementipullorum]|nr:TIGR01212 family radical SAM protein [Candidatus Faecousia excrementipullorum]
MYRSFHQYCREVFGCKVYKLSLDGGFTCPNRDGTLGTRGCIFCSSRGSGDFAPERSLSIPEQLRSAKARVEKKCKDGKYIAYFQAFTNTYAPADRLRRVFTEAIEPEEVVGLSVATRPDCLPPEVLSLLGELNRKKPVLVELGLQTIHEASIRYIRRGYENAVYFQAVKDLKALGIPVVTHIILGLPGESEEQMVETTQAAVAAGTQGVKFHLLHVLSGTDLHKDYQAGKFSCLTLESYARVLKKCLGVLPPEVVVHRITGDGAKKDLVAPLWSADKKRVLNYLTKVLQEP